MITSTREELREEIEWCCKLYPEFKEVKDILKAAFDAEAQFYRKNPEAVRPCSYGGTADQIKQRFIDDKSLGLVNTEIKSASFKELFSSLTGEISRTNPELKDAMEEADRYLSSAFPVIQEVSTRNQVFHLMDKTIENTSLKSDLATFLFHFTFSSLFQRTLKDLVGEVDTSPWRRGECPLCEAKPHYGQLRKEDGAKIMECWLCGTRWQHARVQCPGCQSKDQEQLGLFTVEGNELCRIHFCKECHGYYKIFDARRLEKKEIVQYVHHLATLSHDVLAAKEGFSPISGLEWINREEISGVDTKH